MNHSKLLRAVNEQAGIMFTGRINILSSFNHQFLGAVLMINGEILSSQYKKFKGLKSLISVVIDESKQQGGFSFVVEPELVTEEIRNIYISNSIIFKKILEAFNLHEKLSSQKPPSHLRLQLVPSFFNERPEIDQDEFEMMNLISEEEYVDLIYQNDSFLEYEVTKLLMSLRQKEIIKVISVKEILP